MDGFDVSDRPEGSVGLLSDEADAEFLQLPDSACCRSVGIADLDAEGVLALQDQFHAVESHVVSPVEGALKSVAARSLVQNSSGVSAVIGADVSGMSRQDAYIERIRYWTSGRESCCCVSSIAFAVSAKYSRSVRTGRDL